LAFDRRDFQGEPLEWLLDLEVGGEILRLAQRPLDAPTGVGGALAAYAKGLAFSGEVPDAVDPFSDTPSGSSVDLTLHIQHSIPAAVEQGFDLSAARGKLWQWSPTTGAVLLVVSGVLRGVEYRLPEDPLTCSLEELEEDDSGRFPPADARVTDGSWPNAAEKALSEYYPWILGSPGRLSSWVTPGLLVDTVGDLLLVAAHPVEATTLSIVNDDDGTSATIAVTEVDDGLGRIVSVVDLTASGVTIDPEASYFARWGATGGGLQKGDGTVLTGAGDVIRWMLTFSRLRVDYGRLAASLPALNAYRIDTAISARPDARFPPWDWLTDHLLPILPVSVRSSPEGFYPVIWRFDATADMAVAHLEVPEAGDSSPSASLRTTVSFSSRDRVANEITLHYRHDPRLDSFAKRLVLTGDQLVAEADHEAFLNLYCLTSRSRYRDADGNPETWQKEESTEVVEDDGTAGTILAWWAQRYALQARLVGYTADLQTIGHLEAGDVVTITHPGLSWTKKVALVEEVIRTGSSAWDLDLRLVEDPAQVRRGVG